MNNENINKEEKEEISQDDTNSLEELNNEIETLKEQLIREKAENENIRKRFKAELVDQSLLITDTRTPLYYLFDLQIGKIKSPYIEISLYTFIFSQFIGILLNNILNNMI